MLSTNRRSCSRIAFTLVLAIFTMSISARAGADDEFSMKIMDVFNITDRGTVLTGKVDTGFVVVGDSVCVPLTNGETAARTIDGIEMFRKLVERAEKGQWVGLMVQVDKNLVEKGALMQGGCEPEDAME